MPHSYIQAMPDPDHVQVMETHISWVLLAGEFAYKLKKPVTLPFLDYGTIEKRRACCAAELHLNRRFAPELYLEVVELAGEPAVKMRRFAEEQRLDHVCARGALTSAQLSQLARSLAAFQNAAAVTSAPTFGSPETILADALENFTELVRLLPAEHNRLTALENWTQRAFAARHSDFVARRATGRVRDGHGDLHLGNLVLLDGQITPFDCIEFNDSFRCIDVASEIAFTLLDLLDHGEAGLATWLLDAWLTATGDFASLTVMRFYLVYRALVRAKVAAIRGDGAEAAGYLDLAQRLAVPNLAPTLTITSGPSGCGKTYASSRRLASADFLDTVRIRSDVERKRLFGLAPEAASDGSIYTPEATRRTYERLAGLAEEVLQSGWSVIVDAAFLKRIERDRFRRLAARLGVSFEILAPTAPPDVLARRITMRRNDASEATVAVLEQQLNWLEPLEPDEPSQPI
ncbi:MAG: AAA family ATPase [Gammaproteobacteria bacterium]|nr:AAA family ATPase [Gammaproteobacteria bacterium]MBU4003045.1 AAA family ATPase [Gammaproteobacteria bacterium]MBU4019870.1 AAA family ATPase [Gammaproteobacteria bacterium]MBU4095396.1 AAA family ATPase [Gammaproteobacteria bacterium]MBU4147038.1 AAA family ATPase [Gammaproteobacteria bacterium]